MEPMVDFQLGAANIRMCFTVRDNGESSWANQSTLYGARLILTYPCHTLTHNARPQTPQASSTSCSSTGSASRT